MEGLTREQRKVVRAKLRKLRKELAQSGGIALQEYPPSAFVTEKVIQVLQLWDAFDPELTNLVSEWAWQHLFRESVLISSESPDADVFELAYSALIAVSVKKFADMTPQERDSLAYVMDQFFCAQDERKGTWPRSRPLFLYPNIGYAYCFDFELLVQMLSNGQMRELLEDRLVELGRAAMQLDATKFALGSGKGAGIGWASGHHGDTNLAESWSTASVFHYCFELHKMVSEAIRREVFAYVGSEYSKPTSPSVEEGQPWRLPEEFLDSKIPPGAGSTSFKKTMEERFLKPLVENRDSVVEGHGLPSGVRFSGILYGPPGTSKTRFAALVADRLGWPLLKIDPSHLTRKGLDEVHAETNTLFGRLESCEQVVVLLDEFDELVTDRDSSGEMESRFLTTAMLPKLADLYERRRIVYLLATNHLERFDAAISRHGRFDIIVPLMPPTADEKLRRWPELKAAFEETAAAFDEDYKKEMIREMADLTYLEADQLVADLSTGKAFRRLLEEASERATMNQEVGHQPGEGDPVTWKTRIEGESPKMRIPSQ